MPRTVVFGAKAAPGLLSASRPSTLINNVARVVNNDPEVKGKLNVYFPWNYNVRLHSTSSRPPISMSRSPRQARKPPVPAT